MAANFSSARPVETDKQGAFLHDRTNRPEAPAWTRAELARRFAPFALYLLFAGGFLAIAFQTWAAWDNHRAWHVAITTPLWVLGGMAFAHVALRGGFNLLAGPVVFLVLGLILLWANVYRGTLVDGDDAGRDALTIISAILFLIAVHWFIIAAAWLELKRPTRAPAPEM